MTTLVLRAVSAEDMPFLQKLYASTRQEEMAMAGLSQAQAEAFLAMQFNAQQQHYQRHYPNAHCDVIEYQAAPAGRLYIDRRLDEIRIVDIALLPEYRGRGFGKQLLGAVLKEAQQRSLCVSLHVAKGNPAQQWYQRLGFVKVEDKGPYDFMRYPGA